MFPVWQAGSCGSQVQIQGHSVSSLWEDGSPAGCVLWESKGISQEVMDNPIGTSCAGTSGDRGVSLFHMRLVDKSYPYNVVVDVDGVSVNLHGLVIMEIDTGVTVSLMSAVTFEELWPGSVDPATVQLCSYSGEKIPVAGEVEVTVSYKVQVAKVHGSCSGHRTNSVWPELA